MFLIAKIVRGRRLLHQLEQQEEKEKAAKHHEKLSRGVSGVGSIAVSTTLNYPSIIKTGTIKENLKIKTTKTSNIDDLAVIELVEFSPKNNIVDEDDRVNEERKSPLPTPVFSSDQQQKQQVDRIQIPKKRAVRQRTDASLPSDEIEKDEMPDGYSNKAAAMRRTSSMPSVVESEQHLLHLIPQRQQRQHHLFHHSPGTCCLKRGLRASTIRHYNYEDRFTKLHKRALRFTWQRLLTRNGGKRIEVVFEEVFERMMHKIPIMKEMFNTRTFISAMSRCEIASPRDHARLIVKMFEAAIKNLEVEQNKRTDTDSGFDPKLLGQAHGYLRPYGFTSALWEAFGEAVIDIVVNQEAVRDLPGASQAWVVLTACLVDQLRAGFDSSLRECPFKHQKSRQRDDQLLMNGGYVAETLDIDSSSIEDENEAETFFKEQNNQTNKNEEQLKILIEAANQQQNYLLNKSKIPPIKFEDFTNLKNKNNNFEDFTNLKNNNNNFEDFTNLKNKNNLNLKYKNSNIRRKTITTLLNDDNYLNNNNNTKINYIEAKEKEEALNNEKRRYSIMPQIKGEEEEENNKNKLISQKRLNFKFIQNVASTEI